MYPPSFRRKPESSVPARIAEEDKHRVKNKGYLLRKQSHSTAEDAEITEKTNNRVKDKTIIRRPFVASGLAPDVKDNVAHPSAIGLHRAGKVRRNTSFQ